MRRQQQYQLQMLLIMAAVMEGASQGCRNSGYCAMQICGCRRTSTWYVFTPSFSPHNKRRGMLLHSWPQLFMLFATMLPTLVGVGLLFDEIS